MVDLKNDDSIRIRNPSHSRLWWYEGLLKHDLRLLHDTSLEQISKSEEELEFAGGVGEAHVNVRTVLLSV